MARRMGLSISRQAAIVFDAAMAVWHARRRLDGPFVLLGRDMWPVVAALRAVGLRVQYFHWARVTDDWSAAQAWQAEIACGAVVVDSGFAGSILDRIQRRACPSIRGLLLSTAGEYPRTGAVSRRWVLELEDWPKPTGRCVGYERRPGGLWAARLAAESDDSGVVSIEAARRSLAWIEEAVEALVRATGRRKVGRVRLIVGDSPEDRVGLAGQALLRHIRRCLSSHRGRLRRVGGMSWREWRAATARWVQGCSTHGLELPDGPATATGQAWAEGPWPGPEAAPRRWPRRWGSSTNPPTSRGASRYASRGPGWG